VKLTLAQISWGLWLQSIPTLINYESLPTVRVQFLRGTVIVCWIAASAAARLTWAFKVRKRPE
jgi:hypothetical protein